MLYVWIGTKKKGGERKSAFKRYILSVCYLIEWFRLCLQDVDPKAYQEALDNYCPHQGGDQLVLQEDEEGTNQVNYEEVEEGKAVKRK